MNRKRRPAEEALGMIAARFRLLGEPMRLRILHALATEERSVKELVRTTGAGQANVSKHLALMLDAGVVARRRDGLEAKYRICDPSVLSLCRVVCSGLSRNFAERRRSVELFARKSPRTS